MRKFCDTFYIINILVGLCEVFNYLFVFNNKSSSSFIFFSLLTFYLVMIILYFKVSEVEKVDLIIMILYLITVVGLIVFSLIFQVNRPETFSLLYYAKIIMLLHFIMVLYPIKKIR